MKHVLFTPENLKKARKAAGYTQKTAAEALDAAEQTVSAYEQGKIEPSVKKLREMGRLYGVTFIV